MSTLASVQSRALIGLQAPAVTVEVHLANGLPSLNLVGLADVEVKEARERVRCAIVNSGLDFPANKRITVNLAPADLPKDSGRFDLPIALGILAASGQIDGEKLKGWEFAGELSLSGALRPVRGALAASLAIVNQTDDLDNLENQENHFVAHAQPRLVLPLDSAHEAALPPRAQVWGAQHLLDVVEHFVHDDGGLAVNESELGDDAVDFAPNSSADFDADFDLYGQSEPESHTPARPSGIRRPRPAASSRGLQRITARPIAASAAGPDLADVKGQVQARRALEIAAAGGHGLLLIGPPGAGKSMLAARFAALLPPMTEREALESAAVASLTGRFAPERWGQRPTAAPHHTASAIALVGGGSPPRPGEISLAHHGVLFLDEFPEFARAALEALREPLENGHITISRAARSVEFPAQFQLIAAMNPCPCGFHGSTQRACRCTPQQVQRYQARLSGPLLDRIDLHVHVPTLSAAELLGASAGEASAVVRERVIAARQRAMQRQGEPNQRLQGQQLDAHLQLDAAAQALAERAAAKLGWSARATHRALRVARTIADLAGSVTIAAAHVAEAMQYRRALVSADA